jgi:hypothetical protein
MKKLMTFKISVPADVEVLSEYCKNKLGRDNAEWDGIVSIEDNLDGTMRVVVFRVWVPA